MVAVSMYLGDKRHELRTRAHLLGRCNNEPVKVLDFFKKHVTEKEFDGNEILQRIARGLKKEGFGHKIRFKPEPKPAPKKKPEPPKPTPMEKFKGLGFADILEKRGLVKYAMPTL